MPLPKTKLAYLAGIIDGEGTITLVKESRNNRYEARLIIVNTNKKLIDWLKSNFGGYIQMKPRKNNDKQAYAWSLSSKSAIELLEKVKDYLLVKKEQYLIVITNQAVKIEAHKENKIKDWQDGYDYLKSLIKLANQRGNYAT